jgi:hypothetical protein
MDQKESFFCCEVILMPSKIKFSFLPGFYLSGALLVLAHTQAVQAKAPSLPNPPLQWSNTESQEQSVTFEGNALNESIGISVQNPNVSAGILQKHIANGAVVKPEKAAKWATLLAPDRHYFLEIDGPRGHSWVGHRVELDEQATRSTNLTTVRWDKNNTLHTRVPDKALAGATYQIRPHITLMDLFGTSWENRWRRNPSLPPIEIVLGQLGKPPLVLEVRGSPNGAGLLWTSAGRALSSGDLVVAPGAGFVVRFPNQPGLGSGIRGETRNFPCRTPLISGWNLLAYPFAKDLRLGQDWWKGDTSPTSASNPQESDRIVTFLGSQTKEYGLWASPSGPRWRLMNRATLNWEETPQFLDVIPTGYAFYLFRQKANSDYVFLPPVP